MVANEYEQAFEAFLARRGVPLLRIAEQRRPNCRGRPVKQFDYLVLSPAGPRLLVEVKGRRLPVGRRPALPERWVTADDLASLAHWQQWFGPDFTAGFCFVSRLARLADGAHFVDRDGLGDVGYGFTFAALDPYRRHARLRSLRWRTYHVAARDWPLVAVPLSESLRGPAARAVAAGRAP